MNSLIDGDGQLADMDGQAGVADGSSRVFNKALPVGSVAVAPRKTVKASQDARVAAAVAQGRMAAERDQALLANRSLFIFSEENFIRKYAKIIIEWGYSCSLASSSCDTVTVGSRRYCYVVLSVGSTKWEMISPRLSCIYIGFG